MSNNCLGHQETQECLKYSWTVCGSIGHVCLKMSNLYLIPSKSRGGWMRSKRC